MAYYYAIKNYKQMIDLITSVPQRRSLTDGFLGQLLEILSSSSVLTQHVGMTHFY